MNTIEKKFLLSMVRQMNELKEALETNKKAQAEVDEKYRLLAEQEKKNLTEEADSLSKMIVAVDTNGISVFGKPISELDNVVLDDPKMPEENNDDLEALKELKEKIDSQEEKPADEGTDFDVDKVPAPASQDEDKNPEESEGDDIFGDGAEEDAEEESKESDGFEDFGDWPDTNF